MASRIHAIILAAGRSERFGRAKLLAEFRGAPLLQHSLKVARSTFQNNTWLVTGRSGECIADAAGGLAGHVIHNPAYAQGIGSSIACGVNACSDVADAVVIMLADQPLIRRSHLSSLVRTWKNKPEVIVATEFAGILGPPAIFGRDYFAELRKLTGDTGAKQVIDNHPGAVSRVRFDAAAVDIDTPDDLVRLVSPD